MRVWKIALAMLTVAALVAASVVIAGEKMEAGKMEAKKGEMMEKMEGKMTAEIAIDQPAPNFSLMGVDGKTYSLADFKGKNVVLEWVNFDCPFVKKHYHSGNMQQLQQQYGGKEDIVWLSICSSAPGMQGNFTGEELTERIKQEEWSGSAYLIDADGSVGRMYGAKTTPHMFVIDKEGVLRYAGAIDNIPSTRVEDVKEATNFVSAALDNIMANKAVATKSSTPYGCSVKYAKDSKAEANKTL